jgi:hypothetical protein
MTSRFQLAYASCRQVDTLTIHCSADHPSLPPAAAPRCRPSASLLSAPVSIPTSRFFASPGQFLSDLSLLISTIRVDKPCQFKSLHCDKSRRIHSFLSDKSRRFLPLLVDCFGATTRVPACLVKSCQCRLFGSCLRASTTPLKSTAVDSIPTSQVKAGQLSPLPTSQIRSSQFLSMRQVASHPCGSARLLTSHVASPRHDSSNQAVPCLLVSTSQVTASRLIATSQVTTSPLPSDESEPYKSLPYRLLWSIRFQSCRQVRSERATSFQPDKPNRVLPFRFSATTRLVSLPVIALPVRQVISASTQRAATCQVGCASWLCTSLPTTPDKTRLAGFEPDLCEPIRLLRS